MTRFSINVRRLALWSVAFLVLLCLLLILFRSVFLSDSGPLDLVRQAPGLQKVETEDGVTYLVPDDRVPETFEERDGAAAFALLPSRVPELDAAPEAPVPSDQRQRILEASKDFLSRWETFSPGSLSIYRDSFASGASGSYLTDLETRIDSKDPVGVCAGEGCTLGSLWVDSNPRLKIIDWSGDRAYVTGYGTIQYGPLGSSLDNRSGQYWTRAYGLLLREESDRWFVERAASENVGVLEI
jgi:hypothetical protein